MKKYFLARVIPAGLLVLAISLVGIFSKLAKAANTHSIDIESSSMQYLSIADGSQTGLDIAGNLTIEAWLNLESDPVPGDQATIVGKFDDAADEESYLFSYGNTGSEKRLRFQTSDTGANFITATSCTPYLWVPGPMWRSFITLRSDRWSFLSMV